MTFLGNRIGQSSTQSTQSRRAQPRGWGFGFSVFIACLSLKERQLQNLWASSGGVSSLPCSWVRIQWLLFAWVRGMVSAENAQWILHFLTFFHCRESGNSIQVKAGLLTRASTVRAALAVASPHELFLPQAECPASMRHGSNSSQCTSELGTGSVPF